MSNWTIAIDGPSASGKSTVSRQVAAALGAVYVDSGSLYRGLTWACLEARIPAWDEAAILGVLEQQRASFFVEDGAVRYTFNGKDPRAALRSGPVVEHVSRVAAIPGVRRWVVERLRGLIRFGNLVMEGRDIGTVVFPDAIHKFYLDARPEERARRRQRELAGAGAAPVPGELEEVSESLARRDALDRSRTSDPLRVAPGAVVLDTTAMTLDQVVAAILTHVRGGEGVHGPA
jgi:cytidylate kinase